MYLYKAALAALNVLNQRGNMFTLQASAVALLCALSAAPASALEFDLTEMTCMTAILYAKDMTFNYEVKGHGNKNLKLEITDVAHGDLLKRDDPMKEAHSIKFHVPQQGEYEFCFQSTDHNGRQAYNNPPTSIAIKMTEDEIDMTKANGEFLEGLKPVKFMIDMVLDDAKQLSQAYEVMRDRENQHRNTSENTHDRLLLFSLLSIFVLLGVGAHHVYHMKNFFKKKKLI